MVLGEEGGEEIVGLDLKVAVCGRGVEVEGIEEDDAEGGDVRWGEVVYCVRRAKDMFPAI